MTSQVTRSTKLASQDKSKVCSHSKCGKPSVITVTFGNEKRKLCQQHHDEAKRKNLKFKPEFVRASLI